MDNTVNGAEGLLTEQNLAVIHQHAIEEFPREACGFILASGVRRARNVIDELHAADPDSYERTSATGYALGIEDAIFLDASFDTDDPVLVIYHSHPNGRAYFSEEDVRRALLDGRPVYPGVLQLVVGVEGGSVREARLFDFADGAYREISYPGAVPA
ncbi:Mov34/MPN/PAD-1 family protein [Kitasatospora sp. NPDC001540]|uniref:Mov34/MPN/PAD-1 family protein n=1 Tax=Kitasatospora sp. NPDC001540 TaxID=3364014 RepID=UPI00368D769F